MFFGNNRPELWIPARPVVAFEFCAAGVVGQRALLDDCRKTTGFAADMNVWRKAMRFTGASQIDAMEAALGEPLTSVLDRTSEWANVNAAAIRAVAVKLVQGQLSEHDVQRLTERRTERRRMP